MKYKAIFCDFDGTLCQLPPVSKRNIEAVKSYVEKGGKFIITTGRIFQAAYPQILSFGVKMDRAIVSQGAQIYDLDNIKPITTFTIEDSLSKRISDSLIKFREKYTDLEAFMYLNEECYFSGNNLAFVDTFCDILKIKPKFTNSSLYEFIKKSNMYPTMFLAMINENDIDNFIKELNVELNNSAFICKSRGVLLEIMPKNVNKGTAVEQVCKEYGIMLNDVICIGDSGNDVPMLQKAGLSCAPSDASSEVLDIVDYVSCKCDDGAVANIIEKYCLGDNND